MKTINIIFPHQLFYHNELLENDFEIYLIEEYLFFRQFKFHKQKIAFHRATMKAYEQYLLKKNKTVHYVDSNSPLSDIRNFKNEISDKNIECIQIIDPTDDWLTRRIKGITQEIELSIFSSSLFINSEADLSPFFRADKKSFFQTSFYKQQRKKLNILLDDDQKPIGGKWTYDTENRKKYPKDKTPPVIKPPKGCEFWSEAVVYTNQNFSSNYGQISVDKFFPVNFYEADDYLNQFLEHRFSEFGVYEDAIVKESSTLNHSLLSPLINVGLLKPLDVVNKSLSFAEKNNIPINSTEGFVRQLIGWREFIRGMYMCKGRYSRTKNYWGFKRKIPSSFYDATTGIEPIDDTINKVLKTGYCHHIERLMVLGSFMLLCEFDPDAVYDWFMELFIDSYDWVMVPNVYGMSLFADGGVFATKPYISGSNYIKKMSNYETGQWCAIWDALFWRFIIKNESFFKKNPRTNMLVLNFKKMDEDKKSRHLSIAEEYLISLDND
ncbi:MAG: cryptochrome/photolyase family protein [Flavobacteriales bacterium]